MPFDMVERLKTGNIDRSRRGVLASVGVVVAAAVGVPVGSADEHEEFTDEEILTLFELVLEGEDIQVAELEIERDEDLGDEILSLEYYPLGTTEAEIIEEMGYITGAFAESIALGLDVDRFEATALDLADEPVSRWHVETEWAEAYNAGEITAEELGMEAFLTLEPVAE